jgi:hypothetical protein
MKPDKLISEARARIIWGEASLSVREFLISNGVSDAIADAKLREFTIERNAEIRKIGIRNTLIGVVLTAGAGITIYVISPLAVSSVFPRDLAVLVIVGLYGCWKLLNGIIYLVRPQSEHKSIPDIIDSEITPSDFKD